MPRPILAEVDLDRLARNYRALRARVGASVKVMAVVKANAYGHGAVPVARTLEAAGADWFGVADVNEGAALRTGGIRRPILVFGVPWPGDVEPIARFDLTASITGPAAAERLQAEAERLRVTVPCHLKIDTGLGRLGLRAENLRRTVPPILDAARLRLDGVYTHFAVADEPGHALTDRQLDRFRAAVAALDRLGVRPALRHAANSAALLSRPDTWFDMVRPGLALYGLAPSPAMDAVGLEPALALRSAIVGVRHVRAGESVGYGARFVAPAPGRIGIVPIGYGDGIDPRLAGRAHVLVGDGRPAPIVGSVCMDMLMIDITAIDATVGDRVTLVGEAGPRAIDIQALAATAGTIPYDLLCRIGARVPRAYINSPT